MRLSEWVKHPYVEKCPLASGPHSSRAYVQSGFCRCVGRLIRVLPDKGTSAGSTHTSLHTSLRRLAEMFLNSLCLEETKPPFLHEKAWLRSKLSPQTHFDGIRERGQLNLKFRASQNSCFVSTWPLSSRGKLVSQLDDPDSRAISLTCFWASSIRVVRSYRDSNCFARRSDLSCSLQILDNSSRSSGYSRCWC